MEEALTCPIGFEAYDDKQSKPFILECGHTLSNSAKKGLKCIQLLKSKTCPHCRKPFETINPNYTLIEIITSKSNHSLLQIKSSETKLKLMRVEEYLKELESTINQGKLLLDKNLIELKEEINKSANSRINEINVNRNKLLSKVDDLERNHLLDIDNLSIKFGTILNKNKIWQDLSMNDGLTAKEYSDLNNELKYLEAKIDDTKNINYYMFTTTYSEYDYVSLGEISNYLSRFSLLESDKVQFESKATNTNETISASESLLFNSENSSNSAVSPTKRKFSFNKIKLKGHTDEIYCVCFNKNSNRLYTGSQDKTIKIWSFETGDGECLATLSGHSNVITGLILISDTKLASSSWDNTIKIWDLNTNKLVRTLKGHDNWVQCLCLSPNNQLISGSFDKTIKMWDLNSSGVKTLKGHNFWIICLKIYAQNKLLSGSRDRSIKMWNLSTMQCEYTFSGHKSDILCLEILPNERLVSGSGDKCFKIWDLNANICLNTFYSVSNPWSLSLFNNKYLLSGHENGDVLVWSLENMGIVRSITNHSSYILDFTLLNNNENLFSYSCQNNYILVTNTETNKLIR